MSDKYTYGDIQAIYVSLAKLFQPDEFPPAKLALTIAEIAIAFEYSVEARDKAREAAFARHSNGEESIPVGTDAHIAFNEEMSEVDESEVEVLHPTLEKADLLECGVNVNHRAVVTLMQTGVIK